MKKQKEILLCTETSTRRKRKGSVFWKKAAAICLTAAIGITSLPAANLGIVFAASPTDRTDNSIVYFVDCGDYVINTAGEGEQFGTHNSVTDQVYGEDPQTGYKWGIVDGEEYSGNNIKNPAPPDNGGVYTANTWAFEQLETGKTDYPKETTNRYSKNFTEKGLNERFINYAFELEEGDYEVTVGCSNPWDVSKSPVVTGKLETSDENTVLSESGFSVAKGECKKAEGTVTVPTGGDKLTVDIRGTGNDNLCVNVAYIKIKSVKAGETEDEKKIRKDLEALTLPETAKNDLTLPDKGENGSTISWESKNTAEITNEGKGDKTGT